MGGHVDLWISMQASGWACRLVGELAGWWVGMQASGWACRMVDEYAD